MSRPDTLAKFQDGFGQGKFCEGIAASGLNRLDARFDQWMVWNGKGQSSDDDIGKRFAGNVHALPENCLCRRARNRRSALNLSSINERGMPLPCTKQATPACEKMAPSARRFRASA